MKDSILLLCIIILAVPCIIYAIIHYVKDMNTKTLNEYVKNKLSSSDRILVDSKKKDYYKKLNWKRMLLFAIAFFLIIVICIWLPALNHRDNTLNYVIGGLLAYAAIIIILVVLTLKDNNKLSGNNEVYVIKGYLRNVYIYRGTRIVLVYYDFVRKKYIAKRSMLNAEEIGSQVIERNKYVDILVRKNADKLIYISLK